MSSPFEVRAKHIKRLSDQELVHLLRRLVYLEAKTHGILAANVAVPEQLNIPDDGADGLVAWTGQVEATQWFPRRHTLFQVKGGTFAAKGCETEPLNSAKTALSDAVEEMRAAGGAYVLVQNQAVAKKGDKKRKKALKEAFTSVGADPSNVEFKVYDANAMAQWTNTHISAAIFVARIAGVPLPSGAMSWRFWSGMDPDRLAFVSTPKLDEHIGLIQELAAHPRSVLRLVGVSNFGKSRLVLEALAPPSDPKANPLQAALSASVAYLDARGNADLPAIVGQLVMEGTEGLLVVDECDIETHKRLSEFVRHKNSKISLITIDYDTGSKTPPPDKLIKLERLPDEAVKLLLKQGLPGLKDADIDRAVTFSAGFPGMATLVARSQLEGDESIAALTDKGLVERLLWGRNGANAPAQRVLEVLSIFRHCGLYGQRVGQRDYAAALVNMSPEEFHGHAEDFAQREILYKRGDFVRVTPPPLALYLAADYWRRFPPDHMVGLVAGLPDELREPLLDQLAFLHHIPKARELAELLMGPDSPFADPRVLRTELGARVCYALAPLNPEAVTACLWRAFSDASHQQLLDLKSGRRHLVWTLERLAFGAETFGRAARLMLALAAAENESWGNNATAQFTQFFQLYLSGTQAPPEDRYAIVDEALATGDEAMRSVALKALSHATEVHHFSRMGGVDAQGSRTRERDWQPNTHGDIHRHLRNAGDRLLEVALESRPLRDPAKEALASSLRGLITRGLLTDVIRYVSEITKAHGFWVEAREALDNTIEWDSEDFPNDYADRLKAFAANYNPADLRSRLESTVSRPAWRKTHGNEHPDFTSIASELLSSPECGGLLLDLTRGQQRRGFLFGQALAGAAKDQLKLFELLAKATRDAPEDTRNIGLLAGMVAAWRETDATACDGALDGLLDDDALGPWYLHLISSTRMVPKDLPRIFDAVDQEVVMEVTLHHLTLGSVLDHLPEADVCAFAAKVAQRSMLATVIALDILYMYCLRRSDERKAACRSTIRSLLLAEGIISQTSDAPASDDHHVQQLCKALMESDPSDDELYLHLTSEVVNLCESEDGTFSRFETPRVILEVGLAKRPDLVWPILGDVIVSGTWHTKFHLRRLMEEGSFARKGALLPQVPADTLMPWARNHESARYFLARSYPVQSHGSEKYPSWSPLAVTLLDEFGDDADLLSEMLANIHTRGFAGTPVPLLEHDIKSFSELTAHERSEVRRWAARAVEQAKLEIKQWTKREEEREFGVW